MRKIFEKYPNGIRFAANPGAVVKTSPSVSVKQFIYQRIRWAGKWKYNASLLSTLLAIFIFCFQISVILLPFGMLAGWIDPFIGVALLLSKAFVELNFLKKVAIFFGVPWKWSVFLFLQLVYPFYVVFIGLIANRSSFEWKGRKLKSLTVSTIKK